MRIEKIGREGEPTPKWYGLAYRDFDRDVRIFYPIPINIFVTLYMKVRAGFKWGFANFVLGKEEFGGRLYKDGFKSGYDKGAKAVWDSVNEDQTLKDREEHGLDMYEKGYNKAWKEMKE